MISISVSCNPDEIPAARELISGFLVTPSICVKPSIVIEPSHKTEAVSTKPTSQPGKRNPRITEEQKAEIQKMRRAGKSPVEIAKELGIKYQTVYKITHATKDSAKAPDKAPPEDTPEAQKHDELTKPTFDQASGLSVKIIEAILSLRAKKYAPPAIADIIEEQTGACLSEEQILDIIIRDHKKEFWWK